MDDQQALNILKSFLEQAVGAGLFKRSADVLATREAIEHVEDQIKHLSEYSHELNEKIKRLESRPVAKDEHV